MEPYERSELDESGEGLWALDRAQPLTQLRVTSYAFGFGANSSQPSPIEEGKINAGNAAFR